jgi:DNA-binding CsgD family transcriptional regulator
LCEIYAFVSINKFRLRDNIYNCIAIKDITELKTVEKELLREKQIVEEKNIALRSIIETFREQNEAFKVKFSLNMEKELLPLLKRLYLTDCGSEKYEYYHKICKKLHMVSDTVKDNGYFDVSVELSSRLSQAEERVFKMVVNGHTTKEIAETLCLSGYTVQTHRRNIRRKLNLNKKQVSIVAYIKSMQTGCGKDCLSEFSLDE